MNDTFCSDKNKQGGGVAAPVAGKIFSEVLPYLNIEKEEEEKKEVKVPNLIGMTVSEAEKILKESNLNMQIAEKNEGGNMIITRQIPEKDIVVKEGTSIIVHSN